MNLLNQVVIHKEYGRGKVIEQDGNYFIVDFSNNRKKFAFPSAFTGFLSVEDVDTMAAIRNEIELKEQEDQKRKKENSTTTVSTNSGTSDISPKEKTFSRKDNQQFTFLVHQGGTFAEESQGGFLWAPKGNATGRTVFHWENLLLIKEGNIIINVVGGYIKAISIAKGPCYDAINPLTRNAKGEWSQWALNGRRVDCDYFVLSHPIKQSDYKDNILQYAHVKYSPFDRHGSGNMGYLYELHPELAKLFVTAAAKKNTWILDDERIRAFAYEE